MAWKLFRAQQTNLLQLCSNIYQAAARPRQDALTRVGLSFLSDSSYGPDGFTKNSTSPWGNLQLTFFTLSSSLLTFLLHFHLPFFFFFHINIECFCAQSALKHPLPRKRVMLQIFTVPKDHQPVFSLCLGRCVPQVCLEGSIRLRKKPVNGSNVEMALAPAGGKSLNLTSTEYDLFQPPASNCHQIMSQSFPIAHICNRQAAAQLGPKFTQGLCRLILETVWAQK